MTVHYLTKRDVLAAQPPFSAERLREIFATHVVKPRKSGGARYSMPTDSALTKLAGILNRWHAHFYGVQTQRQMNEDARRAEAAINELREVLPRIADTCRPVPGRDDTFGGWRYRATARLLEAVQRDATRITWRQDTVVVRPDGTKDNPASWQSLADVLPADFADAWTTTNGPAGVSESGPLVAFLSAVIPMLTGEHPQPSSIRRRLVERKAGA